MDTAREAAQEAAAADHPMTRNDDRHRILAERVADGPVSPGPANPCRDASVGFQATGRDEASRFQYPGLELGHSGQIDPKSENRIPALEIPKKLFQYD